MEILHLQGFTSEKRLVADMGLGEINNSFPNGAFPLGAVHELISDGEETSCAASGFISGLLSGIMRNGGTSLWISASRTLFPLALKSFGVQPDKVIFIDLQTERDVLWAMDEALRCDALTAVVGEVNEISFTASRRLQLAVEQSKVTGFVLRNHPRKLNTTACVSRWRIKPLSSESTGGLPGIGFPRWNLELLRIRNGRPGTWNVRWENGRFHPVDQLKPVIQVEQKKAG